MRGGSVERRQHGDLVTGAHSRTVENYCRCFKWSVSDVCYRKVTLTAVWRCLQQEMVEPKWKQWWARRKESGFKRC